MESAGYIAECSAKELWLRPMVDTLYRRTQVGFFGVFLLKEMVMHPLLSL
jgi:hypothetical protein